MLILSFCTCCSSGGQASLLNTELRFQCRMPPCEIRGRRNDTAAGLLLSSGIPFKLPSHHCSILCMYIRNTYNVIYICVHVFMYMYYVCVRVCIMYICMYVRVYIYIYMYVRVYMQVCNFLFLECVCFYVSIYIYIYMCVSIL